MRLSIALQRDFLGTPRKDVFNSDFGCLIIVQKHISEAATTRGHVLAEQEQQVCIS